MKNEKMLPLGERWKKRRAGREGRGGLLPVPCVLRRLWTLATFVNEKR